MGPFKCYVTQMGGITFSGKKRYEGVRFNLIRVTGGWVGVQIPRKKRYETLEWPLCSSITDVFVLLARRPVFVHLKLFLPCRCHFLFQTMATSLPPTPFSILLAQKRERESSRGTAPKTHNQFASQFLKQVRTFSRKPRMVSNLNIQSIFAVYWH